MLTSYTVKSIKPTNIKCWLAFNVDRALTTVTQRSQWSFLQRAGTCYSQSKTGFCTPFNAKLVGTFLCRRTSEHVRSEKLMTPKMTIPDISALVTAFNWKGGSFGEPSCELLVGVSSLRVMMGPAERTAFPEVLWGLQVALLLESRLSLWPQIGIRKGQSSALQSLVTQCRKTVDIFWFLCFTNRNTSKEKRPRWLLPFSMTVVWGSLSQLRKRSYRISSFGFPEGVV